MYENLLSLPYFQGMSKDDITRILDKVTFDFVKYNDGEIICHKNESCDKFLIHHDFYQQSDIRILLCLLSKKYIKST